jgi:integrase
MQATSSQTFRAKGWTVKRGPRKYEARWLDATGRRRAKSGFVRKSDADKFLKTALAEVKAIRQGDIAADRPATINALLDTFLEKHGRTVDVATEKKLRQQLKHVRTTFGTRNPDSLRKAELEDWRLDLSDGVRHGVFCAFRQVFAWASDPDRGLMERNPSNGIKNPKRKRHERADVHPFESWEDVEAVAAELDARYRAIPIVGAGTGLRPEELFGLHRADVDRENRRLHVRRRFTQGVVKPGTKTGAERFVPFGEKVLAALDSMPVRIDTPILFPAAKGGYIDLDSFRYREWKDAVRGAGIAPRRINDLRHTYATWSLTADVPAAKLAKMMGTSIAQIEDTYHRFLKSDEARYASALDSYGAAVNT